MAAPKILSSAPTVILACALVVGFYANARAANVEAEPFGPPTFGEQFLKCKNAGGWEYACTMEQFSEAMALQQAKQTLLHCAALAQLYAEQFPHSAGGELHATAEMDCARQRDYIRQRWGVR